MDEILDSYELLQIFEEKEKKRLESINKSKQRPEYKQRVRQYNKQYYTKKKEDKNNLTDLNISRIILEINKSMEIIQG
jgi:hypothetical protein